MACAVQFIAEHLSPPMQLIPHLPIPYFLQFPSYMHLSTSQAFILHTLVDIFFTGSLEYSLKF